jgi:hypothetical protein
MLLKVKREERKGEEGEVFVRSINELYPQSAWSL